MTPEQDVLILCRDGGATEGPVSGALYSCFLDKREGLPTPTVKNLPAM